VDSASPASEGDKSGLDRRGRLADKHLQVWCLDLTHMTLGQITLHLFSSLIPHSIQLQRVEWMDREVRRPHTQASPVG